MAVGIRYQNDRVLLPVAVERLKVFVYRIGVVEAYPALRDEAYVPACFSTVALAAAPVVAVQAFAVKVPDSKPSLMYVTEPELAGW